MNDIYITLTGNVAAEPRQYSFDEGTKVTSLRVLTSHRYFDKRTGQWTDGEKVCFTVRCWRALGENVAASVRAGHPVVVSGKLRIREFGAEGDRRFMPEIEASAVGHDLRWGTGVFAKPERGGAGSVSKEMRDRLDEETRDWAMGPRHQPSFARPDLRAESTALHPAGIAADRTPPWELNTPSAHLPDHGDAHPLPPADTTLPFQAEHTGLQAEHTGGSTLEPQPGARAMADASPSGPSPYNGNVGRPASNDGSMRVPNPEDNHIPVPASANGDTLALASGKGDMHALGSASGDMRTLGSADGGVRGLGLADGDMRELSSEDGADVRGSSTRPSTARSPGSDGGNVRKPAQESGTARTRGAENDTVRILGGEERGRGRTKRSSEPDTDAEPTTLATRTAA
ncbi:single-stranded DNA-binding protein [Nonomuraea candida]|uniref:single-stranded DNA-binding protein n=1 Tax=Nonomuraea candida TaxID=359159 RepID=UPI000693BDE4|nr:single-stranded DNA-binding protein [Nonomuraea candida]